MLTGSVINSDSAKPLTVEELGAIDRAYEGFPDFEQWSKSKIDVSLWENIASKLEHAREGAKPEALRRALNTAMRAAAIETGAIEGLYPVERGFTITVATEAVTWAEDLRAKGEEVRQLFEAQLAGYELALDAATARTPISEAWIRRLHEVLSAPQATYRVLTRQGWQDQTLPKGQYKERPNHVRLKDHNYHAYAPVHSTPSEMHRFVEQTRTEGFASAHPILQASYGHYVTTAIHPFADGNGRVARALASVFLYRSHSIPLVVFSDQRNRYFDSLHSADLGDPQPFVDFTFDLALDTFALVIDQLAPGVASGIDQLKALLTAQGGLLHGQLDALGAKLLDLATTELNDQIAAMAADLPAGVTVNGGKVGYSGPAMNSAPKYRVLMPNGQYLGMYVTFNLASPVNAQVNKNIVPLISLDETDRYPFVLAVQPSLDGLRVRLDDLNPTEGETFKLRLKTWIAALIGEGLQQLTVALEEGRKRLQR